MSDSAPPSERRRAAREVTCFPAYVEHDSPEREAALIADVAPSGALLLVRGASFRMGEVVKLELLITQQSGNSRRVTGSVVRVEPLPIERVSVWTHQVGIEFDSPIELTDDEQRIIREQCDRLGVRR